MNRTIRGFVALCALTILCLSAGFLRETSARGATPAAEFPLALKMSCSPDRVEGEVVVDGDSYFNVGSTDAVLFFGSRPVVLPPNSRATVAPETTSNGSTVVNCDPGWVPCCEATESGVACWCMYPGPTLKIEFCAIGHTSCCAFNIPWGTSCCSYSTLHGPPAP